jgi:hypothetical protein
LAQRCNMYIGRAGRAPHKQAGAKRAEGVRQIPLAARLTGNHECTWDIQQGGCLEATGLRAGLAHCVGPTVCWR